MELDKGDDQGRLGGIMSRRMWKALACLESMRRLVTSGNWLIQVYLKSRC